MTHERHRAEKKLTVLQAVALALTVAAFMLLPDHDGLAVLSFLTAFFVAWLDGRI